MLHNDPIAPLTDEVISWRHHIHANPELGFQEKETARFVAKKLRSFGVDEVHENIGGTGVVGVLRNGNSTHAIGLRAELDALPVVEKADVPYISKSEGVMHACGHDGHSAMLLGAAKLLSETRSFDGTIYFIFQPAEENEGGSMRMIEDGLFRRFPVEAVYAVHNWPGLKFGTIATRVGPQMAAVDNFELTFEGLGSHAAMPQIGDDPILAASAFVQTVQRIVSRSVDPLSPLVVSITQVHGGNVGNIVPKKVWVQGTCRFFEPGLSDHCEKLVGQIAQGIASAHSLGANLQYKKGYPPVVNTPEATARAIEAASSVLGSENVVTDFAASLGCEDFAYMVRAVGGCYVWIGAGEVGPSEGLHGDKFVFNDGIVPAVLRYWQTLVEQVLPLHSREAAQ
ncbi:M20 aminoacylase family protein [Phyllobacterium endophyticum]|uniref:Amidohydrolase n=1 Tax=Phyllobacterium endophyticum TaxID=1149773 RepID=A0A2P7AS12_9HYPH|nr:M20 aminoacylase family protein [Phyllobacterium endophyticum]MBB3236727.1 hippurate hydrolase [Phyllobacterium endophyticum]PSH57012.1 amidohydrolase [Phyllobacterium endophyticum]TYR39699.1 amidohydrolase [Phyllobacterium endophyticum]